MRCFYHNTVEAVGICKNCNRGVCSECAREVTNAIACKDRCEAEAEAINEMISRGKTSYQKTSGAYSRNAIIYGLFAVTFGVWGAIEIGSMVGSVMLLISVVFIVGAILNYSTSRKFLQSTTQRRT
ncbi:MAG TPA: hypothetical protein VKB46_08285 [Pyrinomonadaceae bacterium]|nr:hypothetical protein [Pyrinomonadaceae bacterium]